MASVHQSRNQATMVPSRFRLPGCSRIAGPSGLRGGTGQGEERGQAAAELPNDRRAGINRPRIARPKPAGP
jgi:hypothetical protein